MSYSELPPVTRMDSRPSTVANEEEFLISHSSHEETKSSVRNAEAAMMKGMERKAVLKGLQQLTQGSFQLLVYSTLNFVSFSLVLGQFLIGFATEARPKALNPCKKGFVSAHSASATDVWFTALLFFNGLATAAQLVVWFAQLVQNIRFRCTWGIWPGTRYSIGGEPMEMFRALQIDLHCLAEYDHYFSELDADDKYEAMQDFLQEEEAHDEQREHYRYSFKYSLATRTRLTQAQRWVVAFRCWVGILGAVVEPMLMSLAEAGDDDSFGHKDGLLQQLTKLYTGQPVDGNATNVRRLTTEELNEAQNGEECLQLRGICSSFGGMAAAVGFWQASTMAAYKRLIRLDQLRDQKYQEVKKKLLQMNPQESTEYYALSDPLLCKEYNDYVSGIEAESMETLGPEGRKFVLLLGGHDPEVH